MRDDNNALVRKFSSLTVIFVLTVAMLLFGCFSHSSDVYAEGALSSDFSYEQDVFEIRTTDDLTVLMSMSKQNSTQDFAEKTLLLLSDIAVKSGTNFDKFAGTFRGNGFILSGVTKSLFTEISSTGLVTDFTVISDRANGVIAGTNKGTVSGVTVYGTAGRNGVVNVNDGTLSDVTSFASVEGVGKVTAFVYSNSGSIDSCYVCADVTASDNVGLLCYNILDNAASLKNSMFIGTVTMDGEYSIYPFGQGNEDLSEIAGCGIQVQVISDGTPTDGVNSATKSSYITKNGTDFRVFDASGQEGTDLSVLSGSFYLSGGLPVSKSLFAGDGTSSNKFVLNNFNDFNRLVFASSVTGGGYYAALGRDVTKSFVATNRGSVFGSVTGEVSSNEYVISESVSGLISGWNNFSAAVSVVSVGGGDGYGLSSLTAVTPCTPSGSGSLADPYVIKDLATLRGALSSSTINAAGEYAIVTDDIYLNNAYYKKCESGLGDVEFTVDFLGHSLYNAFTAPFGNVSGEIFGLNLVLSLHADVNYGVCGTLSGSMSRVTLTDKSDCTVSYGLAETCSGEMTLCLNSAKADYAFCNTLNGSVTNCAATQANGFAWDGSGEIAFCTVPGKHIAATQSPSSVAMAGSDYVTLVSSGFNMDIFGYEAGREDVPVIKNGGVYLTPASEAYYGIKENWQTAYGVQYYSEYGVPMSDIEAGCVNVGDVEVRFFWQYSPDGGDWSDYSGADGRRILLNCGYYRAVKVEVYGEGYITEIIDLEEPLVIQMAKGDYDGSIKYGEEFCDATFSYCGEAITSIIAPKNKEELEGAGFTLHYTLRKGSNIVSEAVNVGTYVQTVTATSDRYNTLTYAATRKIIIQKAELTVTLSQVEITYGQAFDATLLGESAMTAEGQAGCDAGKSAKQLIEESGYVYVNFFNAVGYTQGSDAGEYVLKYTLSEIANYRLKVTGSVLNVVPATMSCTFTEKEYVYDGTDRFLTVEEMPAGAKAVYTNNGNRAVGEYTVSVTVTCRNYLPYTAEAVLIVTKATLILTATVVRTEDFVYGYVFDENDFAYTVSAPVGGESPETVMDGITVTAVCTEEMNAGDHEVGLSIDGEADNYDFSVTKAVFNVQKSDLKAVFSDASFRAYKRTVEYNGEAFVPGFPENAFGEISYGAAFEIKQGGQVVLNAVEMGDYTLKATVTPINGYEENYLTTVYEKSFSITPVTTSIAFEQSEYIFTYNNGENFAVAGNFTYHTDKIAEDELSKIEVYFTDNRNMRITNISQAGTYYIVAKYETDNHGYKNCEGRANITVRKKTASLTVTKEYTYSGSLLTPDVSIGYESEPVGALSLASLQYSYEGQPGRVASAGEYTLIVTCLDGNYELATDRFPITILKKAVTLSIANFSFEYGSKGGINASNGYSLSVADDVVNILNYYVAATDSYTTLSFRLMQENNTKEYFATGKYTVNRSLMPEHNDYDITLNESFTVEVTARTLNLTWTLDGEPITGSAISLSYRGVNQIGRIGYRLTGFANHEDESFVSVNISVKQGTKDETLRNSGEYSVGATLAGSPSYVLTAGTVRIPVTIEKIALVAIEMQGGTVMQREYLPTPKIIVHGLIGEDEAYAETPAMLRGYKQETVTNYNRETATIGQTVTVTATFTFADYTIGSGDISSAKYIVVQGYRQYTLSKPTYTYDGMEKSSVINEELEEGVTVTYTDNKRTNVGKTTVYATVTYPTGRQEMLTSSITITKATPTIICDPTYGIYMKDYTMSQGSIMAQAYLNANIPDVPGTFSFNPGTMITKGRNEVPIKFIPLEANYNEVSFVKVIVLYEVTADIVNAVYFSDITVDDDGKYHISAPMEITLSNIGFEGLSGEFVLYYNGNPTSRIYIDKSVDNARIEVKYAGNTVYSTTLSLVYGEEAPPAGQITIDYNLLELEGVRFIPEGDDSLNMYLSGSYGYISMNKEYADEYYLVINGTIASDGFSVSAETGEFLLSIRNKRGLSVYLRNVKPKTGQAPSSPEGSEIEAGEKKGGFKTYYYYIIGGVAGLLVAVGVVILILKLKK